MMTARNSRPADAPTLSIVIVTWNCSVLMRACLDSIAANAGSVDREIIVVDNASTDDTLAVIAARYPQVRVIANATNLGFARASNQGLQAAHGELVCLLNPDTELREPDTLSRLVARMRAHPDIGMAGCRLVFPDGRHQVGDGGHLPTLGSTLVHALLLNRLAPRRFKGLFLQEGGCSTPYTRVGWVCGACTLVRPEAVRRAGPLDGSYFLYGEDIEWGCRFNRLGETVAYFPDITIIHHQGGTQKGRGLPATRWIDGLARVFHDLHAGRNWQLFRWSMAGGFALRAMLYRLRADQSVDRSSEMLVYARHVLDMARPKGAPR